MKYLLKSVFIVFCTLLVRSVTFAQINISGEWKVIKYEMSASVKNQSALENKEVSEEFIYKFNENKAFSANAWLNPFRGGINKTILKGSYELSGDELKITCKKDDDNKNSYFYYQVSIENDYLVLSFDKDKLIRWFKDSESPDDALGKKLSRDMFSTLDCKIYLKKKQ